MVERIWPAAVRTSRAEAQGICSRGYTTRQWYTTMVPTRQWYLHDRHANVGKCVVPYIGVLYIGVGAENRTLDFAERC